MIASGYEDCDDAKALRSDPAFKLAQNVLPSGPELASQPTRRGWRIGLICVHCCVWRGRSSISIAPLTAMSRSASCSISTTPSTPWSAFHQSD